MSSGTSAKVPDDDPLMIAWKACQASEDYDNSRRWAETFIIKSNGHKLGAMSAEHPHLEGSLWAMFVAGWTARAEVGKSAEPSK